MSSASDLIKRIRDEGIRYVDLRFTDLRGKLQHVTLDASIVDADMLEEGVMFDGSSIAGWKAINESDMVLMPDPVSAYIDPFFSAPTLCINCDIFEPATYQPYNRDPRSIAKKAEAYMSTSGIGDSVLFGPEPEFFLFDDVRYSTSSYAVGFEVEARELITSSSARHEGGNNGHHIGLKKGYFPVPPLDSAQDIRGEMLEALASMGVVVEKHHHEVASAQHELGIRFAPMIEAADHVLLYKYGVQQVAQSYGKTATFMPKPVYGDNGSGMHCHQSIWKDGKPLFAGDGYAGLSETSLFYIGGIIRHARAINAFTNPTTNSYKRLVPGFEAPVLLAYSAGNRSAACRIPFGQSPKSRRVEVRFPDPLANPYLAFTALLMAGLDGIRNRIHPGDPMDKDLYELPREELRDIPTVALSLREALDSLDADRDFLKAGGVMDDDFIDAYIALKMEEVARLDHTPHPVEYEMYYSG